MRRVKETHLTQHAIGRVPRMEIGNDAHLLMQVLKQQPEDARVQAQEGLHGQHNEQAFLHRIKATESSKDFSSSRRLGALQIVQRCPSHTRDKDFEIDQSSWRQE